MFGHVELKGADITGTQLATTYGNDDKISGIVVFKGFAYDNKRLANLKWAIVDHSDTNAYTSPTYLFPATNGALQNGAAFSSGTWTGSGDLAYNATDKKVTGTYKFEVSNTADGTYLDERGHRVAWTLSVDTSYIKNVVEQDARIYVYAQDAAGGTTTITNTATAHNVADDVASVPTYQVDVLPYITGVTTRLSALNADGTLYGRTALGHYPIGADETSVILKGYNLAAGNENVTLNAATVSGLPTGEYQYTVSGNIKTINNLNNNQAHGDYDLNVEGLAEKTKVTNMYNRQPNTTNNLTMTDDVYFDMWQFNSEAAKPRSGSLAEPVMKISPSNMIGFAFANGPAYLSMPGTVNNQEYSYYYWQQSYDLYTALSLAYDSAGHTYGTALGADMNARQADLFNFVSDRWGKGETGGKTGSTGGTNANRLESMGQRTDSDEDNTQESSDIINFDKKRIQSVSIATSNANNTSANVYLAYYDNTNDEIRFRCGSVGNSKNNYGSITDDFSGNELHSSKGEISTNQAPFYGYYDGYSYTMTGPDGRNNTCTPRSQIVATTSGKSHDNNNLLGKAGNYLSIGVTKDANNNDVVVMVWYDQWTKKLCYAYNTNPMAAATHKSQNITGWTVGPDILSSGGEYCQLVVDGNGGIHIAAYDNGDLKYAYLSSYNDTTVDSCTVDSYDIIGQNLTIDVAKEGDNYIPHIGYYALSRTLPKYAYLAVPGAFGSAGADSTDSFTGVWECSYIPTDSTVPQDRINVGLFKESKTVNGKTVNDIRTYSTTDKKAVNANKSNIGTSTAGTENGKCYGNGTSNAVLGYVIKISSMLSYIETAQLK